MVAPLPGRHRAEGTARGITRRERWVVSQGLCWSPWGRLPSFRGAAAAFARIAALHTRSTRAGPDWSVSTSRKRSRGLLIGQPVTTAPGMLQCCYCHARLLLLPGPNAALLMTRQVQGRHMAQDPQAGSTGWRSQDPQGPSVPTPVSPSSPWSPTHEPTGSGLPSGSCTKLERTASGPVGRTTMRTMP